MAPASTCFRESPRKLRITPGTFHAYDSGVQFANSQWWESLPEEVRQVLLNALDGQQGES